MITLLGVSLWLPVVHLRSTYIWCCYVKSFPSDAAQFRVCCNYITRNIKDRNTGLCGSAHAHKQNYCFHRSHRVHDDEIRLVRSASTRTNPHLYALHPVQRTASVTSRHDRTAAQTRTGGRGRRPNHASTATLKANVDAIATAAIVDLRKTKSAAKDLTGAEKGDCCVCLQARVPFPFVQTLCHVRIWRFAVVQLD